MNIGGKVSLLLSFVLMASLMSSSPSSAEALIVTGPPTITAVVGTPISATYTATGGDSNYTLNLVEPLPAGFTFTTAGSTLTVSGTATAPITSSPFTVTATDTSTPTPLTASTSFTLSANFAPLNLTGPATISAVVGTATSATYTATGGNGSYTLNLVEPLPAGFSFTSAGSTLTVSGTATAPIASTTFTVAATDTSAPAPETSSTIFTLSADYAPLIILGPSQISIVVGEGQSNVYSASGAVGAVVFSVGPSLPGVSIFPNLGALVVLAPQEPGSYSLVITAVDSRGVTGSKNVTVTFISNQSGPGTPRSSSELRVNAPILQMIEGQEVPALIATYSNRNAVSTPAVCEIFTTDGKIVNDVFAGTYDIVCKGATSNDGSTVVYVSGVLRVGVKTQDPVETKLEASIERPRVIYVSPNVETDSTVTLQNTRGSSVISVHFNQKSVLTPTTIYFAPWPSNIVEKSTPVVNITAKDNKNETLTSLEKPMALKFPKVPTNSIPVFSTNGNDWVNFPQITKTDLATGLLEGYYTDANGEITIYSQQLGIIGFRVAQLSFALEVVKKKSIYGLTEEVQVKLPRLLGTGEITYESLLSRACSISAVGVVKTITGGECLVIAKKASDSKYSTGTSAVLTLKFASPPTPKPTPTPKPSKSPTNNPKPGPTTPAVPKAPNGYVIIPGVAGVFTPAKVSGAKNSEVLKLGSQISAEFNQKLNSQISVSLSGLARGSVISPILVTPEGSSAILQTGKYDSVKQYSSQALKFTKTGAYRIIFRIAGTNTARVITINIK